MKKIELEIIALSHSVTQSHSYAVVLGEKNGSRRLPIVIGGFEAQAIAVALENMTPSRPLTHDLMKNICENFDVELQSIIINNLVDGIFYAQLICVKNGEVFEIDSRTSDALALAVRFKCAVYTYEFILETAGITVEDDLGESIEEETEKVPIKKTPKGVEVGFDNSTLPELNELLKKSLEQEDYERAAKIRDEINRRKENS